MDTPLRPSQFKLRLVGPALLTSILVATAIGFGVRKYLASAPSRDTITLTVWFLGGDRNEKRFNEELIRRYERAHQVRVQVTYYDTLDDYLHALKGALEGQQPFPDLARSDQGAHSVDAVIRQGRLLDLTAAAAAHKWTERLRPGALEYLTRRYAGGIYLIPSRLHFSGVFYNRQVFEKLGLPVPRTEAEFEALLARLKEAGYVPLALGARTGDHLLYHWYALINNRLSSFNRPAREVLDELFAGHPAVSFEAAPFRQAAEKLRQWRQRGYFSPAYERLTGQEAYDRFLAGESPLYLGLGGAWAQSRAQAHPPQFVIGFFPFPPTAATSRPIATTAPTSVWQVFKGPRQEQAIALIDVMLGPETSSFMLQYQNLPALRADDLRGISIAPHVAEEITALNECEPGIFYDNASPSLREVMARGLAQVLHGEQTSAGFTSEVEAAFQRDLEPVARKMPGVTKSLR